MIKNRGMHHTSAHNLQPTTAPLHIHFQARLDERKITWTKSNLRFSSKQAFEKFFNHIFKISERNIFADHQPLHLMEISLMRRVSRFKTENAPGNDNLKRRIVLFHISYLHRRSVGTQKQGQLRRFGSDALV